MRERHMDLLGAVRGPRAEGRADVCGAGFEDPCERDMRCGPKARQVATGVCRDESDGGRGTASDMAVMTRPG